MRASLIWHFYLANISACTASGNPITGLPRNDAPQALSEDAEELGGEVVVRLRREAVVARSFVLRGNLDRLPDFVDGERTFL